MYSTNEVAASLNALLKHLDMEFVSDSDHEYDIRFNDECERHQVYKDGRPYDNRYELFASLRTLMTYIYPNLVFKYDDYITDYEELAISLDKHKKSPL